MKQYSKRHYFENFILSIFIFFCYFGQVSEARDYTVRADVSTRSAVLGSSLEFFITVEGTQDADAPALSEIDGFQTRYVGPSRQFSMVNGNISNSINFRYVLVPTRTGDLEIPALTLNVNGQGYTTQAIPIKVFDSSQTALDDAKENTQKTLADKLSLVFSLSQDTVYLHQRVPVKVMFLKSDLDIADPHYPTLEEKGIVFEPFTEHKMDAQVIKGTMFDIVEFDSYLFPTRTGELEIGPMVMDLNLIAKNTSQQGSYDRPFSDDFFNNFINGPRKVPVQLKSKQVTLKVMDLPEEGRPENFSGGVGQFRFNVAASPLNVRVGDPITLKIEVAGNGLLHAITMPELKESDDFKVYDPVVREENGVKYLEQVIIPKNTDVKNIPMIAFSYFDPSVAKYQTVQDGGMAVEVKEAQEKGGLQFISANDPRLDVRKPEEIGKDIIFIKSGFGHFRPRGQRVYHQAWYYMVVLVLLGTAGFLYFYYFKHYRFAQDEAYLNRLQAPKKVKEQLNKAKQVKDGGNDKEFYDTLFKALQSYLSVKLELPIGALNSRNVSEKLKNDPALKITLHDIHFVWEECESVRYASVTRSPQQMEAVYQKAFKIIDDIEKAVRL